VRKIALFLIIGLLSAGAAFARYRDGQAGLGFVANAGFGGVGGDVGGFFNPGLSFKFGGIPVFWGFFVQPVGDFGLELTGDRHFFSRTFRDEVLTDDDGYTYDLRIDWYLGLGAFANLVLGGDGTGFAFGLRVPAGLSWHIVRWAELSVGVVPGFGMRAGYGGPGFRWSMGAEIALRYWFRPRERRGNGDRENGLRENGAVANAGGENAVGENGDDETGYASEYNGNGETHEN